MLPLNTSLIMNKISKSPDRFSFQKNGYLKRKADEGKTPENCDEVASMVDYYSNWAKQAEEQEADPTWQENNMEYDMRTCNWMLEKVRTSDAYAQNLYAAMCNNDFQKNDFMPRLAGKTWSCSWRYAGGIIADMRQEGDYIDWYCSGIRDTFHEDDVKLFNEEQLARLEITKKYVAESVITDEIAADLKKLSWQYIDVLDESY
jgi:hypothetical protein